MDKRGIFLLTKPPHSDRAELCLHLMERLGKNASLYLAGDGVYNLLEFELLQAMPVKIIIACKEDLEARGVRAEEGVMVPENFYEHLVKDMATEGSQIYSF
jgi:tRNA 2-thiouridine synthesizing protein B